MMGSFSYFSSSFHNSASATRRSCSRRNVQTTIATKAASAAIIMAVRRDRRSIAGFLWSCCLFGVSRLVCLRLGCRDRPVAAGSEMRAEACPGNAIRAMTFLVLQIARDSYSVIFATMPSACFFASSRSSHLLVRIAARRASACRASAVDGVDLGLRFQEPGRTPA